MNTMQAMTTSLECRKLASHYRTRDGNAPLSEQERLGLASLLTGVADLIQSLNMSSLPDQGNMVTFAKRANR